MRNLKKIVLKNLMITGICVLLAQTSASAFNGAVLKGIKVDLLDNQDYRIIVKTDKDVPIKKYITSGNKVVLELKNIRPAQFVNTVYNNATNIDHVIVQPFSGDKLRVFIQGANIASSKIILDTRDEALEFLYNQKTEMEKIKPEKKLFSQERTISEISKTNKSQNQPIFIDLSGKKESGESVNNSIDKVKSVTPILSYKQRSKNNYESVKESMVAGSSINKMLDTNIFDWVLRFMMLGVVIIGGIKMFRNPKNIEIDLSSQNMKSREMSLYKTVESQKELLTKSLGMPGYKENAAKKPNYSSISRYGMKEYQNSQLPPRRTGVSIPERNMNADKRTKQNLQVNAPKPKTTAQKSAHQPKLKQHTSSKVTQKQAADAKNNFDGVKFLETMASIYQKSGRDDLATGIRQNLIQKQQSV